VAETAEWVALRVWLAGCISAASQARRDHLQFDRPRLADKASGGLDAFRVVAAKMTELEH
jgi:hypothetical protein